MPSRRRGKEAPAAGAARITAGRGPEIVACGGNWPKRSLSARPAVFDARLAVGRTPVLWGGTPVLRGSSRTRLPSTLDRIRHPYSRKTVSPSGEPDSSLDYFSAAASRSMRGDRAAHSQIGGGWRWPSTGWLYLLRSPERYQPLVEEALRRAGNPGVSCSRRGAAGIPRARTFLALLACAGEGCSRTALRRISLAGSAPSLDQLHRHRCRRATPPDDEVLARLYERAESAAPVADPEPEPAEDEDAAVIGGTLAIAGGLGEVAGGCGGHRRARTLGAAACGASKRSSASVWQTLAKKRKAAANTYAAKSSG